MTFDHIMEEIEISKYLKNTTYTVGRKGYNSVNMLKTILFGFMDEGYISLRKLHDNCKLNIRYMYLNKLSGYLIITEAIWIALNR